MNRQDTVAGTCPPESTKDRAPDPLRLGGDVSVPVPRAGRRFDLEERSCEYVCASGERFGGRWSGIPIPELLERGEIDPDTTHLLVEAVDGFRACVPIKRALDGIVAIERLDGPDELPRLIAPSIDGTRTVQRIIRIEGRRLDPGIDREDLERIDLTPSEVPADG